MGFNFILNPSFIDTTFQVNHLMIGHMQDGDVFIQTDSSIIIEIYIFLIQQP